MSCRDYQRLLDRGWRRSGCHFYKPNLKQSCCPQYTIRLNCIQFKINKAQRKVITKFHQFFNINGEANKDKKSIQKLIQPALESEFELKRSEYSLESFELFEKYQKSIHQEDSEPEGFKRFLVDSPLTIEEDSIYGSYHYKYYYKDQLIALEVIDILPNCLSSVYFIYDPEYKHLSLGKYSALHSICLTSNYVEDHLNLKYYYMGYYIHSCIKMKYKAEFKPSELLDPVKFDWVDFEVAKKILDNSSNLNFNGYSTLIKNNDTIGDKEEINNTNVIEDNNKGENSENSDNTNKDDEFPGLIEVLEDQINNSILSVDDNLYYYKDIKAYFNPILFDIVKETLQAIGDQEIITKCILVIK
ncbi:hypothetical protein K502DRAFT_344507 [Neoconidiobolus thromboides FSU 785]|nr:hypothetical protein K502DRAFT_344507 [Neoconidiobolus thromboides FSU 785]